ncbi:DUF5615 family PIN-like protein [Streptomyces sp. CBMA156]|uniref:DUF5615 family PIN-like protein n=1 Tax=Streptomyces sp. CBMA156 TaxID=1930280 RepID=UPI0016621449|nr:DUF5615 family PIN-like protein [Streptomyces sp. CBMA156]MBD0673084.1 hypothetical protein [Streptomyces sp. CBMA156]
MRILLDENVPLPLAHMARLLVKQHELRHVAEIDGWAGTKDIELYTRAASAGFQVVITNDGKQMSRPLEVAAIAASGLHRVEYRHNHKHGGLVGLGVALATVCAGLPHALGELEKATGQLLISLTSVDPTRQSRLRIVDPFASPPKHWPTSGDPSQEPARGQIR